MADHVAEKVETVNEATKCTVSLECVEQAVNALYSVIEQSKEKATTQKTKKILEDDDENRVLLLVNLHKIPTGKCKTSKIVKILLPHALHTDVTRVCLFVKDEKSKPDEESDELTKHAVKDLLRSNDVTNVDEVMTLHQLRSEFKTFESKRNLCFSYDLFLADDRINQFLPVLLGREFFNKSRIPLKVRMEAKDLKNQFAKTLNTTVFHLNSRGASLTVPIARTTFDQAKTVENIMESLKQLSASLPGGWANVRRLHVRTQRSVAIPVYVSADSGNTIKLVVPKRVRVPTVMADLPTRLNSRVKVYPSGKIRVYRDFSKPDGEELDGDHEKFMKVFGPPDLNRKPVKSAGKKKLLDRKRKSKSKKMLAATKAAKLARKKTAANSVVTDKTSVKTPSKISDISGKSPNKSLAKSDKASAKTLKKTPAKTPAKSLKKSPAKSLEKTPAKSPKKTPAKNLEKTPAKTSVKIITKTSAKAKRASKA